ncbi:MAG: Hsp20/alpha crystallin family protein [bacterium]|nr:Hsp20/alpha crystallin family protein [bacterium]
MKTDIKEYGDKYELFIDLPGFCKEDLKLHIEDGYLIINAKTSNTTKDENNGKYVHKERYYGECTRSFYVGNEVKEEDIKANFKNGTLNILIPKKEVFENKDNKKYIEIDD